MVFGGVGEGEDVDDVGASDVFSCGNSGRGGAVPDADHGGVDGIIQS